MQKIISDLSILTSIPECLLIKLTDISEAIICDNVCNATHSDEKICELDIGIGDLIITIENNSIKYKFVPSRKLDTNIKATVVNNKNSLVKLAEKSLVNRITSKYQELI